MTVPRDALGRKVGCRTRDFLGIGGNLLDECNLRLIRQKLEFCAVLHIDARLIRLTEDACDACMRILDIVDGILIGLLRCKIKIKIQLAVQGAH